MFSLKADGKLIFSGFTLLSPARRVAPRAEFFCPRAFCFFFVNYFIEIAIFILKPLALYCIISGVYGKYTHNYENEVCQMEYTAIAEWLNTTFSGYDGAILGFMNTLAGKAGGFLTPLMKIITFLGEKGIIFFLLAIGFMCYSKTRRIGVCMFGAVCCGALITNIILKDMVARPRPFEYLALYKSYWDYIGSPAESGYSFPSGHVTAATAGMGSLCFTKGKKMILPTIIVVALMGISRSYLMAHFPSDVLFAIVIGAFSAFIAYLITKAIFIYLEDNDDFPVCAAILDFDLPVHLPDKETVIGLINSVGKGGGRRAKASGEGGRRAAEESAGGGRRAAARGGRSAGAGGFKAALSAAASAGNGLISKVGGRRADAEGGAGADAKAHRRGKSSDWSSRWESYKDEKDGRGTARTDKDTHELSAPARTVPHTGGSAGSPETFTAAFAADDDDADMKIAPERSAKSGGFDWDGSAASASRLPLRICSLIWV